MHYVYILQGTKNNSPYTGITTNLKQRIKNHNSGQVKSTSSKKPYKLIWYCAFASKINAYKFEKYLKSGSGVAFSKKHLNLKN